MSKVKELLERVKEVTLVDEGVLPGALKSATIQMKSAYQKITDEERIFIQSYDSMIDQTNILINKLPMGPSKKNFKKEMTLYTKTMDKVKYKFGKLALDVVQALDNE